MPLCTQEYKSKRVPSNGNDNGSTCLPNLHSCKTHTSCCTQNQQYLETIPQLTRSIPTTKRKHIHYQTASEIKQHNIIPDQISTELYEQVQHEKCQKPQQVLQQQPNHNLPARETFKVKYFTNMTRGNKNLSACL